jgi:hypothetical protein
VCRCSGGTPLDARLQEPSEDLTLAIGDPTRALGREDVRREHRPGLQVDPASLRGLVEDLVGECDGGGADLGHPDLDADGGEPEDEGREVLHLVADHDDPLGERLASGRRRVHPQHVDPGLLQVVDVGGVVDVRQLVHVRPAQRAVVEMSGHPRMLADRLHNLERTIPAPGNGVTHA